MSRAAGGPLAAELCPSARATTRALGTTGTIGDTARAPDDAARRDDAARARAVSSRARLARALMTSSDAERRRVTRVGDARALGDARRVLQKLSPSAARGITADVVERVRIQRHRVDEFPLPGLVVST